MRLGMPKHGARMFFGDSQASLAYDGALARLDRLGADIVEIDIEPFYETAQLLYEGPWVAERLIATQSLLASSPDAIHPVTRKILEGASRITAVDAFAAFYKLEELRRAAGKVLQQIEALVLPTAPTIYTVDEMLGEPITLNSRLGTYTNFVNLLDLCGLAVPASIRADGAPFGITFLAPHSADARLASLGRLFHADTGLPLGALGVPHSPLQPLPSQARATFQASAAGAPAWQ
jgi:allophanate hydrolase